MHYAPGKRLHNYRVDGDHHRLGDSVEYGYSQFSIHDRKAPADCSG